MTHDSALLRSPYEEFALSHDDQTTAFEYRPRELERMGHLVGLVLRKRVLGLSFDTD